VKPATYIRLTKRTLRELRGPYSQRETATIMDVSPEVYQEWELGKAQPGPENLRKLLDHFIKWKKHYGQDPQPIVNEVISFLFPPITEPPAQSGG